MAVLTVAKFLVFLFGFLLALFAFPIAGAVAQAFHQRRFIAFL